MKLSIAAMLSIMTLNGSDMSSRRGSSGSLIPMVGDLGGSHYVRFDDITPVPDLPELPLRRNGSSSPEFVLKLKENSQYKWMLPATVGAMLGLCYMGYALAEILHAGSNNGSN